jgi:hypothetical protein
MSRPVIQALAGAVGGFASWLLAILFNLPLIPNNGGQHIPDAVIPLVFIFFGVMAAFVGVFLSNTKEDDLKRFAVFSLLCGMAWKPVLDGGQRYIEGFTQTQKLKDASQALKQSSDDIGKPQAPEESAKKVSDLGGKTVELLKDTANLSAATPPKESAAAIDGALTTLGTEGAKSAPEASVDALTKIGEKAVLMRHSTWLKKTITSLDAVAVNAKDASTQAKARKASAEFKSIMDKNAD